MVKALAVYQYAHVCYEYLHFVVFCSVNNVLFRNTSLLQINTESQLSARVLHAQISEGERASPKVHYPQPATHQHSGGLSDYPRGLRVHDRYCQHAGHQAFPEHVRYRTTRFNTHDLGSLCVLQITAVSKRRIISF